ncbi:MAG TPA: VWA domain-containing protein [Roseiflexaceae bacterium]|nr:VWA domain-containing protein [Roseiflexaceae bacterium]
MALALPNRPPRRWLALLALLALLLAPAPAQAQGGGAPDSDASDVVLVIDNSGSMSKNDPAYLRLAAAKLFIDLSDPRDKIGVVVVSGKGQTRALTKRVVPVADRQAVADLKGLIDGIRRERQGNETHMGTGLSLSYSLLDDASNRTKGANQRQFVILLSDGLPTGAGQKEEVVQAVGRFKERRFWKIFPIALGEEADPEFLRTTVAEPTGGTVEIAAQAGDLIDRYITVYGRVGDDRFIDRVEVQPNTLAPLVTVRADQQPTHLSVVLVRGDGQGSISSLLGPDDRDVVQPFYQNSVRRGSEPEYQLYTVPPEAQIGLVGSWSINIERPDQNPVTAVVLSRSRLRLRMSAPTPLSGADDSALRFQPLGRPLLLVAGAQVAERDPERSADQPFRYKWVTGMLPSVRQIDPPGGEPVELTDDGRGYDTGAGDGRYSGLLPPLTAQGDYTLRLELPRRADSPVSIRKDYTVRVVSLPTMEISLPPDAKTLPVNTSFAGLLDLPGRADFAIEQVSFPSAFVTRPDGQLDPLTIEPAGDGRFQFSYKPGFAGGYRIAVVAEVRGRGAATGPIHYFDYAEASVGVPEAVPQIQISPAFTETLRYDSAGALAIPLDIRSESDRPERLRLEIEGLPGGAVVQPEVQIAPSEAGRRTVVVRLPEERPGQSELALLISAPDQRVIVQGSRVTVPFRAKGGLPLVVVPLALVALGGSGFLAYRRWRARGQRQATVQTLRRFS